MMTMTFSPGYFVLHKLMELPNFKMEGFNRFEAAGIKYDGSAWHSEEAIIEAYIYIKAHILAKELVKAAKVTIE